MSAFRHQVIDPPEEGLGIVGPPPGSITFNPSGQITLPALAGDTLIFSFRCPLGYDGVILGQYHGASFTWVQGSGDLVFRLSAARRWLKDCGNMLTAIGTNKTMSPVIGGLQVRSGNLCQYFVSNESGGSLPMNGIVFAGCHGIWYPRI